MPIVKDPSARDLAVVDEIDWAKIDALSDEDLARQMAEDPDVASDMADHVPGMRLVLPVGAIRKRLGASEDDFARLFGIDVARLREWELGRAHPNGPERQLLLVAHREPDAFKRALLAKAA